MTFKYKLHDVVSVNLGPGSIIGIGEIRGVATLQMPVIGHLYIVQMHTFSSSEKIPNEIYPFDHISVPENCMQLL